MLPNSVNRVNIIQLYTFYGQIVQYEPYLNRAGILNVRQQLLTLCLIQGKAAMFPAREEGGLNGNECAGVWLSWGSGLGRTQHGIKLSPDN